MEECEQACTAAMGKLEEIASRPNMEVADCLILPLYGSLQTSDQKKVRRNVGLAYLASDFLFDLSRIRDDYSKGGTIQFELGVGLGTRNWCSGTDSRNCMSASTMIAQDQRH